MAFVNLRLESDSKLVTPVATQDLMDGAHRICFVSNFSVMIFGVVQNRLQPPEPPDPPNPPDLSTASPSHDM
ncbi:unnamed protein product [Arabis nemorensis]|uniref:Uncharacterized protein n=1 Tax=Arabis nemorensis TaxID=586526 RepID=A0A565AVY7_9BRAS|nr:unnamed protein product [Arabis nemorensis]